MSRLPERIDFLLLLFLVLVIGSDVDHSNCRCFAQRSAGVGLNWSQPHPSSTGSFGSFGAKRFTDCLRYMTQATSFGRKC